jgi:hypothetical protein
MHLKTRVNGISIVSMYLAKNALLSGFDIICLQQLPSTLHGEFLIDRMNISRLSRYRVYAAIHVELILTSRHQL